MKFLENIRYLLLTLFLMSNVANGNTATDISHYIDDTSITAVVNMKYAKDPILNPFKIHVITNKGIVRLKGTLDTDMQYERATALARLTSGVKIVDTTSLKVKKSNQPLTDLAISSAVKAELLFNAMVKDLDIDHINVETKNGVVFIKATIHRSGKLGEVLDIIYGVDGVKKVKTDIDLQ